MIWKIEKTGKSIVWNVTAGQLHTDDLEMAGYFCADTVTYGMKAEGFVLTHHVVFPTLRLRPNDTHATYQLTIPEDKIPHLCADGKPVSETLTLARIDGMLMLECRAGALAVTHICYPGTHCRASYERVTVKNTGSAPIALTASCGSSEIDQTMGPMGIDICELTSTFRDTVLGVGESVTYALIFTGRYANEEKTFDAPEQAFSDRLANVERLTAPMQLDTGNAVLDTLFRFSKLRAGESVFETRFGYGLLHSPGGYSYFAATWCNDQVEYSGPYFAYTGDEKLREAALNAYRMYMPFMSDRYLPIPSSVIAEGIDYWNGAGDRGDAAMYLYGASRYALTCGDADTAKTLLPAVRWCAEYCRRKIDENGVVASDSDELEGRFPAGKANLCTSTLALAGYRAAAALVRECEGDDRTADAYLALADGIEAAIERHFGAEIHGISAYRYYEGCEVLRSWICMPLCVGIFDRAAETVRALTSEYLLRRDGLLTSEGSETIWDRSTLYGLRGIFASGDTGEGCRLLLHYAENRLLGERAPYAVEAYPEGGRRHLSGESALFCKVILEGLLDITPVSLHAFTVKPNLPEALDHLYLTDVRACGASFDIRLEKDGYTVIRSDGTVLGAGKNGEKLRVEVL